MKSKMHNMPKADKQKAEHFIWLKLYTLHLPGLVLDDVVVYSYLYYTCKFMTQLIYPANNKLSILYTDLN